MTMTHDSTLTAPTPAAPPTQRETRKRPWIGLSAAAVAGGAMILCALRFERPAPVEPAHAAGLEVKSDTAIDVAPGALQWKVLKLGHPERAHAGWTDPVPGRIKIDERLAAKVGSPLAGRVSEVMVDLGQQVKAGDPLFRVSSPDVADLRAQARKAEVDYQAARVVFERTHAMVDAHALAAKDEQSAEQQLKQAEVAKEVAASKLAAIHAATDGDQVTDSFVVTAPRDGVVVEKTLVAHQSVSPDAGNTLIAVADLSSVWVVADLFEADAVDIREGAVAQITSSNASSGPIEGRVDAVSAIVDPGRHTVPIRVSVPNTDGKLRPNAFATVRFATAADDQALSLPSTAIVTDGAKQYVYVWGNEKTFTRRDVVVGASASGRTTVLKGLSEKETVLVEGGILLDNQIQLQGQG